MARSALDWDLPGRWRVVAPRMAGTATSIYVPCVLRRSDERSEFARKVPFRLDDSRLIVTEPAVAVEAGWGVGVFVAVQQ